jgi:hypothetical protein
VQGAERFIIETFDRDAVSGAMPPIDGEQDA